MFHLMNSTIFFISLLPFIICTLNGTQSKNGIDVAYKNEDIFGNNLTPQPTSPSKIDMYVNDWIRKILEANKIGSPGDFKNGSSFPPVSKDHYYIGMKWMIKKYCFNVSSDTACMQVVLKPHVDEEVPLNLRLFWTASDSDSSVKNLGKKKFHKSFDTRKHKKKYHKDDEHYKSRDAFDQFYKYLSKRKQKLLNSPKDNSTRKYTEYISIDALGEPFKEHASKNPKIRFANQINTIRKSDKKTAATLLESFEHVPVSEMSGPRNLHEIFLKENDKIDNEDEFSKSKGNEMEEEENEIKVRNKRAAKKRRKKKKAKTEETNAPTTPEHEDDEESDEDDDDDDEDEDEEDEEEEEEEEDDSELDNDEEEADQDGGDPGIPIPAGEYPIVYAQGDDDLADQLAGVDSSAADTSEEHDSPAGMGSVIFVDPEAHHPIEFHHLGAGSALYAYPPDAPDPGQGPVPAFFAQVPAGNSYGEPQVQEADTADAFDPDAQDPDAYNAGARDWNRCQLPPPRKTSEVLCKVLPSKMVCKLYCIHGHTFQEGIIRQTECELSRGTWSKKFDECLPFVDCTLKLKTAGYLKCTTNTVQFGPRCEVECQKYAERAATEKKTHQCDTTGRWNPPLPHCVEREGIDVVQPPPNMFQAAIDYPQ